MKKRYEAPTVEKIAFRYRDQIVVASGETETGSGGSGTGIKTPSFGQITSENWGQNGCKLHALEAVGMSFCDIA